MSKIRRMLWLSVLLLTGLPVDAQDDDGNGTKQSILRRFEPYGNLIGHLAVFEDEAEIQDNVSWLGLRFSTGERIRFVAHAEFGVNLVGAVPPFRAGGTTGNGFLTLEEVQEPPVFGSRLGYLGIDFGDAGRLTLGKQNSPHYSIANYTTDRLNAFGGQGSLAYPGGGDGGTSGTGRADEAVQYGVTVADIVDVGLQLVFSNSTNDEPIDGFAGSVQVEVLPGLKIGGAYTQTEIEDVAEGLIRGVDGDAEYAILGVAYSSDRVEVGAVYASQENGDLVRVLDSALEEPELTPIAFDADGVELYVRVNLGDFSVVGGFVEYSPDSDDPLLDPDYRTRYFTFGGNWTFAEGASVYTEFRLDDSVDVSGVDGVNVGVLGLQYVFSWSSTHDP